MPSLEGARIKLARAARHLDELKEAARRYLESHPFQVVREGAVYSVKIVQTVPPEWGAIVGDVVHNLRSALDLLAWQLVETGGGTPSKDTCFPVSLAGSTFEGNLQRALAGASTSGLRFVRRLKPYRGGNATLVRLHAVDIVDKHRVILLVGAAHKNVVLNFRMKVPWRDQPVKFPPLALNPADRQFPLVDGAVLYSGMGPVSGEGMGEDDPRFTFELAFGDVTEVRGLPLVATLDAMLNHGQRVVQIAERFLVK